MDSLLELVDAVQLLIPVAATAKIIRLILEHSTDEDKSARNKKIRNVIIVTIACETVVTLTSVIKSYYV